MSNLTAGLIIIGDEILSGRTQDTNSNFIANKLIKAGIKIEQEYDIKTTKMHISLGDLLEMDHFEEKEIFEIIKDTQIDTSKGVKMVDVKSKYHLKVLQKAVQKPRQYLEV